jgi:hypothetical protein
MQRTVPAVRCGFETWTDIKQHDRGIGTAEMRGLSYFVGVIKCCRQEGAEIVRATRLTEQLA